MDKIKCKRVNRVTRFKNFPIITLLTTFSHFFTSLLTIFSHFFTSFLTSLLLMVRGNFKTRRARVTEKKKRQWSAREKLMIITYFEKGHSKRSTANKFGITLKQLREWLSNKEKLLRVALIPKN